MGYMSVMGNCCNCGRLFSFNMDLVPSIRMTAGRFDPSGQREPVCRACVQRFNERMRAEGKPEFLIPHGAYEAQEV